VSRVRILPVDVGRALYQPTRGDPGDGFQVRLLLGFQRASCGRVPADARFYLSIL
jgi:hypothetical protein